MKTTARDTKTAASTTDLTVQHDGGHGSIYLLGSATPAGDAWLQENIAPTASFFGGAIVVEHRFIGDIVAGAQADGLTVGPA